MKNIITTLMIFASFSATAQKQDTLTIPDYVKFIKIDGHLFLIKKTIDLVPDIKLYPLFIDSIITCAKVSTDSLFNNKSHWLFINSKTNK